MPLIAPEIADHFAHASNGPDARLNEWMINQADFARCGFDRLPEIFELAQSADQETRFLFDLSCFRVESFVALSAFRIFFFDAFGAFGISLLH
ncbi:MAG: hypothetical protein ACKVLA_20450, partial [Rhodobacterales bacterium]